jgi:hypothetical protein
LLPNSWLKKILKDITEKENVPEIKPEVHKGLSKPLRLGGVL